MEWIPFEIKNNCTIMLFVKRESNFFYSKHSPIALIDTIFNSKLLIRLSKINKLLIVDKKIIN